MALPDFFLIGAPKAGTTALHAALARHPQIFVPRNKEPKFFLCDGRPPPRSAHRGPGDGHSAREWVWRREEYEALFDDAPPGSVRGESTAFYLHDLAAQSRIRALVPQARLVAVLRDPVDRAFSNWMHLWADGLEPVPDFVTAFEAEAERRRAGWARFWRYRELGLYGEQLEHLYGLFPREQVHVLRYRELVDEPARALGAVCDFLGIPAAQPVPPSAENVRPLVPDTPRTRGLARAIRAGAKAGQFLPPQVWRRTSRPLLAALHAGAQIRPALSQQDRAAVLPAFEADIDRLELVTGRSFADWRSDQPRGSFLTRRDAGGLSALEAEPSPPRTGPPAPLVLGTEPSVPRTGPPAPQA